MPYSAGRQKPLILLKILPVEFMQAYVLCFTLPSDILADVLGNSDVRRSRSWLVIGGIWYMLLYLFFRVFWFCRNCDRRQWKMQSLDGFNFSARVTLILSRSQVARRHSLFWERESKCPRTVRESGYIRDSLFQAFR